MFTGFMSFAGVEVVNDARTSAYTQSLDISGVGNCDECPTLRTALEHAPYTTPAGDNAPWYDPAIPESAQVAGFKILSIDGLGDTAQRTVQSLASGGGVVGARRKRPRELQLSILAIATTECAMTYAIAWLTRVLRGSICSPLGTTYGPASTCANDTLCFLTCCPLVPADINKRLVSLYGCGITSGPTTVRHQSTDPAPGECGLVLCELDILIAASDPGWYSPPVTILNQPINTTGTGFLFNYNITDAFNCTGSCSSINPAGCPEQNVPPFTDTPVLPCVGDLVPNAGFDVYTFTFSLAAFGKWAELVPIITYTASPGTGGEGPLVFTMKRPTPGKTCTETATTSNCDTCVELYVPEVDSGMNTVFDWQARRGFQIDSVQDSCPLPTYTRQLAPFNWPTLTCGSDMCLSFFSYRPRNGRAANIRIDVMPRVDALC